MFIAGGACCFGICLCSQVGGVTLAGLCDWVGLLACLHTQAGPLGGLLDPTELLAVVR